LSYYTHHYETLPRFAQTTSVNSAVQIASGPALGHGR